MVPRTEVVGVKNSLKTLSSIGLRSFGGAILLFLGLGVASGIASAVYLNDLAWHWGAIAMVLCLMEGVAFGVTLGTRRALSYAIMHGLEQFRLGRGLVRLVFERMPPGLTRVPLGQAEIALRQAVVNLTGSNEQAGWLRRKTQDELLKGIAFLTLARFRQDDPAGGIDVPRLQTELEESIDRRLIDRFRLTSRWQTWMFVLAFFLLVVIQAYLLVTAGKPSP